MIASMSGGHLDCLKVSIEKRFWQTDAGTVFAGSLLGVIIDFAPHRPVLDQHRGRYRLFPDERLVDLVLQPCID